MTQKFGFTTCDALGEELRQAAYRHDVSYAGLIRQHVRAGLGHDVSTERQLTLGDDAQMYDDDELVGALITLSDVLRPGRGPRLVLEAARRLEAHERLLRRMGVEPHDR